MSNSTVWIIKKDIKKLEMALSTIDRKDANNFLYTNCISYFDISNVRMSSKNFDAFLHCEATDTYIIFTKDSQNEINYTKQYLSINEIPFYEISLKKEQEDIVNRYPHTLNNYEKDNRKLWIANNEEELISHLQDSKKKQEKEINFYPLINSKIMFAYSDNVDKEFELKNFNFNGVITTIDKIILLGNEQQDIIDIPIYNIFDYLDIKYKTIYFNRPKFVNNEEKRNIKYDDIYYLQKNKKCII